MKKTPPKSKKPKAIPLVKTLAGAKSDPRVQDAYEDEDGVWIQLAHPYICGDEMACIHEEFCEYGNDRRKTIERALSLLNNKVVAKPKVYEQVVGI
jgi:hypothetical protein